MFFKFFYSVNVNHVGRDGFPGENSGRDPKTIENHCCTALHYDNVLIRQRSYNLTPKTSLALSYEIV